MLERAPLLIPLGYLLGGGLGCDATHPTAPDREGRGMATAIRGAMEAAGTSFSDLGHVHARSGQDAGHLQPGIQPLALGRRVHRDLRGAALAEHAEVAAEARVRRGGQDALHRRARQARDPAFEALQSQVGVRVRGHAQATAGGLAL